MISIATPWPAGAGGALPSRPAARAGMSLMLGTLASALVLMVLPSGGGARAEGAAPTREACAQEPQEAATEPDTGPSSGTAPGSPGSTGWTGGTGGSFTGTTPHAPTPGSPTWHPQTVQGLDPKVEPQREPC